MSAFEAAFEKTLLHEGGFVNDPGDPGGATKYGVSLRWLRKIGVHGGDIDGDGDIDQADIEAIKVEDAKALYRRHFWDANRCDEIADPVVAGKLFDLSVNMGNRQAARILQRAARACGRPIQDDGVIGPVTLSATNDSDAGAMLAAMRSEAAGFYRLLAGKRPSLGKYLNGWLRRAYE